MKSTSSTNMNSESYVGIVIPCYNEARRLARERFFAFAQNHPIWHLVFVDDGSTDDTAQVIQQLIAQSTQQNIHLHAIPHQGKAAAVQAGMQYLTSLSHPWEILALYDADQSSPLDELARLINLFSSPTADAVFASRIQYLGTQIKRRWWRHYLGRIFATAISLLVHLPIYDSQCGLKLFKAQKAALIFQKKFISPWFFDVEIILRLQDLRSTIIECPLRQWEDVGASKLKLSDFLLTPWSLAKIYWHYRRPF